MSEIVEKLVEILSGKQPSQNIAAAAILLAGTIILSFWLIKTSFGRKSLSASPLRRNNMPEYIPFMFWAVWVALITLAENIRTSVTILQNLTESQETLLSYSLMGLCEAVLIFAMLVAGRQYFVRQMKGFGINFCTAGKDIKAAMLNFAAILPAVAVMIALINLTGFLIKGDDFQMQRNEGLVAITTYQQASVRITVFLFAALIVPVFEEILFRGLFQTSIRGIVSGAWASVILTSILFAIMHPWTHWPALFVLSICLGYSYEKSGSLLRPVFIHMLFNTLSITAALNQ